MTDGDGTVALGPATRWHRRLTGPAAAMVVLAVFWAVMFSSLRHKSLTADELGHAVAGYTYWKFNDYRLNPENGVLPQRIMGLPLALGPFQPPPRDSDLWHGSEQWLLGDLWFHHLGNDVTDLLARGRAVMGLVAVALGALVWWWARRLFGATGGMLALLLFVANPTILANGALMTSDATCSLFFFASAMAIWATLQRITPARLLLSGVLMGALFASKASAVLMIPIGITLMVARLLHGEPPAWSFGAGRGVATGVVRTGAAIGLLVLIHLALVWTVLWSCYGFRYSAFAPPVSREDRLQFSWEFVLGKPEPADLLSKLALSPDQQERAGQLLARYNLRQDGSAALEQLEQVVLTRAQADQLQALRTAPPPSVVGRTIELFREHHLLPEAYLYGWADAWRFSQRRAAYFNGAYGLYGWKLFFPYTFAVKTPLPVFGLMVLAIAAVFLKRSREPGGDLTLSRRLGDSFYATAPLWALIAIYWAAAIFSPLNIGHRHLLPVYAPMLALCGAAAYWVDGWWRASAGPAPVASGKLSAGRWWRWIGLVTLGLVAALGTEMAYRFPNYIPYFNGLVRPWNGYRHLTDSSVDWGQDLPGVKTYLEHSAAKRPAYLSYAGTASPRYYGIDAQLLYCAAGFDEPRLPIRTVHGTLAELPTRIADARRAWPDCRIVGQTSTADGNVTVYFLRDPVIPSLEGGTYFVSATMLTAALFGTDGPMGTWNTRFEATYQELLRTVEPLRSDDSARRGAAILAYPVARWAEIFELLAEYRFARLAAFLRQREPDDEIGFSILVYRLSDAEAQRALSGPPPELGVDYPAKLVRVAR